MPRSKKAAFSSPDPLEILPAPRLSPMRRNPNSPHKQLQLRLLELNADIGHDKTINRVLQELTPGRNNRGSFSFIDGNVNGREVFITTRKPAAKRGRQRVKDISGDTPKRGRPRKRADGTQGGTPRTPKKKFPAKQQSQTSAENIDGGTGKEALDEDMEDVDVVDGTETSQADMEEDTQAMSEDIDIDQETQTFSEAEDTDLPDYILDTPTHPTTIPILAPTTPIPSNTTTPIHPRTRNPSNSPLPVEPYRSVNSLHSSPPSSPIYEEYQVPIPTSSSPAKPSSLHVLSSPTPYTRTPIPTLVSTDFVHERIRRRARSRSASRERRMSIVPTPWQGLPSTPARGDRRHRGDPNQDVPAQEGSWMGQREKSVSVESTSTRDTQFRAEVPSQQQPQQQPVLEVRRTMLMMESMTPIRNWAAEITEGAFKFDKSPSKIIQLPIQSQIPRVAPLQHDRPNHVNESHIPSTKSPIHSNEEVEEPDEHDEEEDEFENISRDEDEVIVNISDLEDSISSPPLSPAKFFPQLSRLRNSETNSPIVITSSPPEIPQQRLYQWKTIIPSTPTPVSGTPNPESSTSADSISQRTSSPTSSPAISPEPSSPTPKSHNTSTQALDNTPTPHYPIPLYPDLSTLSLSQHHQSRQSSPARSIISQLGDDVVDISSKSPHAAKRAAKILLRSQSFKKIDFDAEEGRRIWEGVVDARGDCDLERGEMSDPDDSDSQSESGEEDEDEGEEDNAEEKEDENGENREHVILSSPPAPLRVSYGPWTKLEWKRLEKCLDHSNGDLTSTINLFQDRYIGREKEELEMRCKAVLLARRRRELEGRKVEFILGTAE